MAIAKTGAVEVSESAVSIVGTGDLVSNDASFASRPEGHSHLDRRGPSMEFLGGKTLLAVAALHWLEREFGVRPELRRTSSVWSGLWNSETLEVPPPRDSGARVVSA